MNAQAHHATATGLTVESEARAHHRPNYLFDALAITAGTGLVLGISDVFGAGGFSGLCLAIGAIFFGLAYIVKSLQTAEETAENTHVQTLQSRHLDTPG